MIIIQCDLVEPREEHSIVLVFGYAEPPPLTSHPEGNLTALLNDIRRANVTLGRAHLENDKIHHQHVSDQRETANDTHISNQSEFPLPMSLVASDDTGQRHILSIGSVHVCRLADGGILFEMRIPGDADSLNWLSGRAAMLLSPGEQLPSEEERLR